jgi:hypothetical protein
VTAWFGESKDRIIEAVVNDPNYDIRPDGTVWSNVYRGNKNPNRWYQLKHTTVNNAGVVVSVRGYQVRLNRLVYRKYVGLLTPGMVIDHIDGDVMNNRPDNLQELTTADNIRKAYKTKRWNE